jgi:hypothetical protein
MSSLNALKSATLAVYSGSDADSAVAAMSRSTARAPRALRPGRAFSAYTRPYARAQAASNGSESKVASVTALSGEVGIFLLTHEATGTDIDQWLSYYDPDFYEGRGDVAYTHDPERAMHFVDGKAAMACWRMSSVVRPTRRDGHPNRPLTAFSIEIKPIPKDGAP